MAHRSFLGAAALAVAGIIGTVSAPAQAQTFFDGVANMGPFSWQNGAQALQQNPRLAGAVVGGQAGGQPLVICRARHGNGTHPGKLWAGRCNIGYGGGEVAAADFDILFRSVPPGGDRAFPDDTWRQPA